MKMLKAGIWCIIC